MSIEKIIKELGHELNTVVIAVLIIFVPLIIGVTYNIFGTLGKAFPLALLALLAGLLLESFLIVGNWKILILKFAGAYLASLFFIEDPKIWPYAFMVIYSLFVIAFNKKKVTPKLTEGITLLQSLSIIYWVADKGLFGVELQFSFIPLAVVLSFALFSIFHALFYFPLTKAARLTLSIWSSLILFIFAIDNIYQVHQQTLEHVQHWMDGLLIGLQYFLLGVCTIYMVQNFILLYIFIPNKSEKYKETWRDAKNEHLKRYSDQQVNRLYAFLCIAYAGLLYGSNYIFDWLPSSTMIWLVFFTFALLMYWIAKRKSATELELQS